MSSTIKYFEYEHLPVHLQPTSKLICVLAKEMEHKLPECPEKSSGMRKLLEAKDCFIRAELENN